MSAMLKMGWTKTLTAVGQGLSLEPFPAEGQIGQN
jgi:hypothetical protein